MNIRFPQIKKYWCKILSVVLVCLIGQVFNLSVTTNTVNAQEVGGSDSAVNIAEIDVIDYAASSVTAMTVHGNYVYLGIGSELTVIDVSDPLAPRRVTSMILSDQIRDILASSQDLIYIVMGSNNDFRLYLEVIDVSNPEKPKHKSQLVVEYANNIRYGRATIHPNAPYLYVRGEHILIVFDVSQPQAPLYTVLSVDGGSTPYSLVYLNDYLFGVDVASFGYGVIRVWDLSQPENPRQVFFDWYDNLGAFYKAFIANNFAFAYIGDSSRTNVFDLSNLSKPKHIATWNFGISIIVDSYAYTDQKIWDISDPTNPVDMGTYSFSPGGSATTADDYRYLIMGNRLQIVTFADRTSPQLLGSYTLRLVNSRGFHLVSEDIIYPGLPFYVSFGPESKSVISGDYLYEVHQECGKGGCSPVTITVYNVSHPRHNWPGTVVNTLSLPKDVPLPLLISLQQDYLLLLSKDYNHPFQIHMVDVSNPKAPHLRGVYTNASVDYYEPTVAISNEYVFVSVYNQGIWVIDFTDPSEPERVAVIDIAGPMTVVQEHLFVFQWDPLNNRNELAVYNVSDPAHPDLIHSLPFQGYVGSLTSMNSYIYMITSQGLLIFEASTPTKLEQIASYPEFNHEAFLTLNKNYIFITELGYRDSSLLTLWFSPPMRKVTTIENTEVLAVPDGPIYSFPAGSFSQPVTVTHQARYPGNTSNTGSLTASGYLFQLQAYPTEMNEVVQPQQPYTLSISYTDDQIRFIIPETLSIYFWDGESWQREESSEVDLQTQIITAEPERLGLWAVMGESRRIYLPTVQYRK